MQGATWAEGMNERTYRWMTGETNGWADKQPDGWTEDRSVRLIAEWTKEKEGRYWYYLVIYCRVLGPRPSLCLFVQVFFPRLVSIVLATSHAEHDLRCSKPQGPRRISLSINVMVLLCDFLLEIFPHNIVFTSWPGYMYWIHLAKLFSLIFSNHRINSFPGKSQ